MYPFLQKFHPSLSWFIQLTSLWQSSLMIAIISPGNNSIYGHKTIQPWALSNWHNSCSCSSHPWWIWWTLYDPEFVAYQRHDQLLTSWLLSSINPDLLPQFVGYESAHSIWKTISQLFAWQCVSAQFQMKSNSTILAGLRSEFEPTIAFLYISDWIV